MFKFRKTVLLFFYSAKLQIHSFFIFLYDARNLANRLLFINITPVEDAAELEGRAKVRRLYRKKLINRQNNKGTFAPTAQGQAGYCPSFAPFDGTNN